MSGSSIETQPAESDLSKYFYCGHWRGSSETINGRGSSVSYAEPLRNSLGILVHNISVVTLLDAPCGGFNWMKLVDLGDIQYICVDTVEKIVRENQSKHGSPTRSFVRGDITKDSLPSASLIMVRDCLFHLSFKNIADFFENCLRSDIPYILVTCNTNDVNSVSVIEHMPAAVRQAGVKIIGEFLKPGGLLILTLDLVPGTKRLWNRDRGKQVESNKLHGKLRDFFGELKEVGIRRGSLEIERGLPGSITNIAFLVTTKNYDN